MIRTILFLVCFVVIIGTLCMLAYNNAKSKRIKSAPRKSRINKLAGCIFAGSLVITMLVPGSFHQVEAGQVAVVKNLGRVVGTRHPGTYFDFYLTNTYTYFDTTVQKLDIDTMSYSSDAQTMTIQMTVQYKIDATKAENILTEYTNMDSLSQRIEKVADDVTKSILSKYTAMKIIETRASISPEIEEEVKLAVGDRYYVSVTAVNLTNIEFTDEFEQAVEDKVVAEQQKEAAITKAEQELEVAKLTAQAKIEEARGDAESQKIIASATAEAMAIKIIELAKSLGFTVTESYTLSTQTVVVDALTNEKISDVTIEEVVDVKPAEGVEVTKNDLTNQIQTITTTIVSTNYFIEFDETHTKEDLQIVIDFVQYLEYLEKWDGKLPEVVTGDSGIDILLPSNPSNDSTTA